MESKDVQLNYFQSNIFFKGDKHKSEKKDGIKDKLKNKLKCSICLKDLENPMYDPNCCQHFCCAKCIDNYFKSQNKNKLPCKICKRMIKKGNLIEQKIISSILETLKGKDENEDKFIDEKIILKCDTHPKNEVFWLCLDCQVKMCPVCKEEYNKHVNHHLVNYERYMKLFFFFQNNFLNDIIIKKENDLKEYIELILLFDQQKKAFTKFFKDFSFRIDEIYSKNQEKLNEIIEESKQSIVKLKEFMINLKKDISSRFKKEYNDIDNIEELKQEIKQKTEKLEIKQINKKDYLDLKNKYTNIILELSKKEIITTLNKKKLFDNSHLNNKIDEKGNYTFGTELSKDKKIITIYLDIDKFINNKKNVSSYIAFIEYGKKKKIVYLEPTEIVDNKYSFENTIPIEKIFKGNNNIDIKLTILYLAL